MNEYWIHRTSDPAIEPVTLAELQESILGPSTDSSLLTRLITVARESFEAHTGIALIEQTWQLHLPKFYDVIRLAKPPLRAVSSITYYDAGGTQQTLAASVYRVTAAGIITEAYNQNYPSTELSRPDAVTVTYTTGIYTSDGASPTPAVDTTAGGGSPDNGNPNIMTGKFDIAKQAIMVLAAHLYENRAIVAPVVLHECPMTYQMMVDTCRVEWV